MKFFQEVRRTASALVLVGGALFGAQAFAGVSVDWTSPADNSTYYVGTDVTVTGAAAADGYIPGTGPDSLDLVLVLDSSGSMRSGASSNGVYKTRREWQRDAAVGLLDRLPAQSAVGVVEFDSDANTVRVLTSITANKAAIVAAINGVDASGSTRIDLGINEAVSELLSPRASATSTKQIIVFSDGISYGNPQVAATNAVAAGVDAVHSVALPGSNINQMRSIAIGNFDVNHIIALGAQSFTATAYGKDGTVDSALITLNGIDNTTPVPVPASLPLMALGLLGFAAYRRKLSAK